MFGLTPHWYWRDTVGRTAVDEHHILAPASLEAARKGWSLLHTPLGELPQLHVQCWGSSFVHPFRYAVFA
jgi:hypothetical protein